MSVVVSIKKKDGFIFVSDSLTTAGDYCRSHVDAGSKSGHYNNNKDLLIGAVGNGRELSIIRNMDNLFDSFDKDHKEFGYLYIRDILVPKIKKEYYDMGILTSSRTSKFPVLLMLSTKDKCFTLTRDGGIFEICDFDINGSGFFPALGCMCMAKDEDPLIRGIKSVKSAIKYNLQCGYPIIVNMTGDEKTYVLDEQTTNAIINKEMTLDDVSTSN